MVKYQDQHTNAIGISFHPEGQYMDGACAWATVETPRGSVYFRDEQDALEYFEWLKVRELAPPATEVDDALAAQRLEDQP